MIDFEDYNGGVCPMCKKETFYRVVNLVFNRGFLPKNIYRRFVCVHGLSDGEWERAKNLFHEASVMKHKNDALLVCSSCVYCENLFK